MIGEVYGKLTVTGPAETRISSGQKKKYVTVRCECGTVKEVRYTHLLQDRTKSCGCVKPGNRTHGLTGTRLHNIWSGIKQRCYDKNSKSYPSYGAKGVVMCDEWRDFQPFYDWAMSNGYEDTLTIDRINNAKVYGPENCEWVTLRENIRRRDVCKAGGRI